MTQPAQTPAGWYKDPEGGFRWWDGETWTVRQAKGEPVLKGLSGGLGGGPDIGLYIVSILLPIVGVIAAIVYFGRNQIGPGLALMATGVLSFVIWSAVLSSQAA